jgi:hypothetical protein
LCRTKGHGLEARFNQCGILFDNQAVSSVDHRLRLRLVSVI